MKKLLLLLLAAASLPLFSSISVQAQTKKVLYETFTNSYDLCPQPNQFDATFKSTLSSAGSKIIHLNHHVANIGDPMSQQAVGSSATDYRLMNVAPNPNNPIAVFASAVDRRPGDNARLFSSQSSWESQINSDASLSPAVSISLDHATYDVNSNQFSGTVKITLNKSISQKAVIQYAILQDNVTFAQCSGSGPSKHNDVVRYITLGDSVLNLSGLQSGGSVLVTYNQILRGSLVGKEKDLKFVAFVELGDASNYYVDNAALLRKNFDTLKSPPQSLSINIDNLDGKTLHPGDDIPISFENINVPEVEVLYSIDNGATFTSIDFATISPLIWTVPNKPTTQGKIQIRDNGDKDPVVTQGGTFTIAAVPHLLTFVTPKANDTLIIGEKYNVTWNPTGVDSVRLEFSSDAGNQWTTVEEHIAGSSYEWTVPNVQTFSAILRLTSLGEFTPVTTASNIFVIRQGITGGVGQADGLLALSVNPNPIKRGAALHVTLPLGNNYGVHVYDLTGKELLRMKLPAGATEIPTNNLTPGSYFLKLSVDGNARYTSRIIVE